MVLKSQVNEYLGKLCLSYEMLLGKASLGMEEQPRENCGWGEADASRACAESLLHSPTDCEDSVFYSR